MVTALDHPNPHKRTEYVCTRETAQNGTKRIGFSKRYLRRAARAATPPPRIDVGKQRAARLARTRAEKLRCNTFMQLPKASTRGLPKSLALRELRPGGLHARLLQTHPELKWLKPCIQHFLLGHPTDRECAIHQLATCNPLPQRAYLPTLIHPCPPTLQVCERCRHRTLAATRHRAAPLGCALKRGGHHRPARWQGQVSSELPIQQDTPP